MPSTRKPTTKSTEPKALIEASVFASTAELDRQQTLVAREKFAELFGAQPDALTVLDLEANIVYANKVAIQTFQLEGEDLVVGSSEEHASSRFEYYDEAGNKLRLAQLPSRQVLGGKREAELLMSVRRKDTRGELWLDAHSKRYRNSQGQVYGVNVFHDVTKSRVAGEQQKAVAYLSQQAIKLGLGELLELAVNLLAETLRVPFAKVLELTGGGGNFVIRSSAGFRSIDVKEAWIENDVGSQAGYTLLTKRPVVVKDLAIEKRFRGHKILHDYGVVSGMTVKISGYGESFGVLGVHSDEPRVFSHDDINFLESISGIIALAVERAEQDRRIADLHRITEVALAHLSLDELLKELIVRVEEILKVDSVSVMLLDADRKVLDTAGMSLSLGDSGNDISIPLGRGVAGRIARSGKPLIVNDTSKVEIIRPIYRDRVRSMMGTPLLVNGKSVGVIDVGSFSPRKFTADELKLLEVVTDRVATAIERSRLYESEQQARKEVQEILQLHLTLQDGIMLMDANGVINFLNPRAEELLGVKKSLVGQPAKSVVKDMNNFLQFSTEILFSLEQMKREALQGQESRGIIRVRSKPLRLVELSAKRVTDDAGVFQGFVVTMRDVTELVTKKEQLEVIYETLRDGVMVFGGTGVIENLNSAAMEMFGFRKSPVGINRKDFKEFADRLSKHTISRTNQTDEAFQKCVREGRATYSKLNIVVSGNRTRYIDIVYAPLKDRAGRVVGVVATYRDMTQLVEQEAETKHHLASLEVLFESSNLFSSTLNMREILKLVIRQTRKLVPELSECYIGLISGEDLMLRAFYGLNKPRARLMGVREGLEGQVIHAGEHHLVKDTSRSHQLVKIAGRRVNPNVLLCLPLRIGEEVIGTLTIGAKDVEVFDEELIKSLLILTSRAAVAIDHAQTFDRALKERGRWEAVVHNSGEGIATIDRSGRVLYWNPALEGITGFTADEVLGRDMAEIFVEEELGNLDRLRRGGEFETPITTRSGQECWVSITSSVIRDEWTEQQPVRSIIIMIRDITRFKEIETKKSEFVSIASHELRTPLTAIKGYLSMLLDEDAGGLNPTQIKFLDRIYRSTDRLVNLVEDILSVSRIEENRLTSRPRAVDVGEVLDSLLHELDYRAQEKSVSIEIVSLNLPPVLADPGHLRQVLFNLVDNAVKYTPVGGAVTISFQRRKGHLITSVSDTGVGIAEDQLPKLFEKFERVNNPLSIRAGGSGLGLFITKNLVERQGGKIWVRSVPRKGSTFSFSLPIYQEDLRLFK